MISDGCIETWKYAESRRGRTAVLLIFRFEIETPYHRSSEFFHLKKRAGERRWSNFVLFFFFVFVCYFEYGARSTHTEMLLPWKKKKRKKKSPVQSFNLLSGTLHSGKWYEEKKKKKLKREMACDYIVPFFSYIELYDMMETIWGRTRNFSIAHERWWWGTRLGRVGSIFIYLFLLLFDRLLRRGSMFVLSAQQFRRLFRLPDDYRAEALLDLGAGDGATTALLAPMFSRVHATEVSWPMKRILTARGFVYAFFLRWISI